jgi:hypothetical protein
MLTSVYINNISKKPTTMHTAMIAATDPSSGRKIDRTRRMIGKVAITIIMYIKIVMTAVGELKSH